MHPLPPDSPEAMARIVALFVVSDARVDAEEIDTLQQIRAFERLGITRERFRAVAGRFSLDLGGPYGWMRMADLQIVDRLLAEVRSPAMRLRVARLAAAVITANGRIDESERAVFDHMLQRWGLTRRRVAQAIREDRVPA